jgi:isopenicillin N synthase-like dioxygenase
MRQLAALTRRRLSSNAFATPCGHPLIDVTALARGCAQANKALRSALFERGYFYAAKVESLPAAYIADMYAYSARMHALPLQVKRQYLQRGGTGCYSGPDVGQPELQYEADGAVATVHGWDYSRARFSLATDLGQRPADPADDPRYPPASALDPPFARVLDELYSRQDELARVLLGAFEVALQLPQATLRGMFEGEGGDFGTIRLLRYPGGGDERPETAGPGIGSHTDFEVYTLMHQSASGLQLMPREGSGHGEWINAPVREAEFIVILGDMLERLTNGTLLATPHRVLRTPHERASIIRFNAFAPETVIAPLPQFITADRPARYSAVTMREHMETTMRNLEAGIASWDVDRRRSRSATYDYSKKN